MRRVPKGIVVTTHYSTKSFFEDFIKSLNNTEYPILVINNTDIDNQFESVGLRMGCMFFDTFIYFQDTAIIKNIDLINKLFDYDGEVSISPSYLMYLGKYESNRLEPLLSKYPIVKTKKDAVNMELTFLKEYGKNVPCLFKDFSDNQIFEEKYGRINMKIENDYLIKYKGTWDTGMIK